MAWAGMPLAAIRCARELGYRKIMLDTLPAMRMAQKLYRELGFTEAPAYYQTPIEGTMFRPQPRELVCREVENTQLYHPSTSTAPGPARCARPIRFF